MKYLYVQKGNSHIIGNMSHETTKIKIEYFLIFPKLRDQGAPFNNILKLKSPFYIKLSMILLEKPSWYLEAGAVVSIDSIGVQISCFVQI